LSFDLDQSFLCFASIHFYPLLNDDRRGSKMNKSLAAAVLATLSLAASTAAVAQETPWLVRVRAVHIDPADKSDPVGGAGASDRLTVSSKTIPELDVSYFFTPNLAAELILTYPQKHDVFLDGQNRYLQAPATNPAGSVPLRTGCSDQAIHRRWCELHHHVES
jgi:hypothetical protein